MEAADVAGMGRNVARLLLQPEHQLFQLTVERIAPLVLPNHEYGREVRSDNRAFDTRTLDLVV